MLILALEAASKSASCCLYQDGEILAQSYQLSGLTHSRTLLPMVEDMLKNCETDLSQVDAVAVSHGPGSFTGVRIGVSAAKGLAFALDKPAIAVSTLAAMARNAAFADGLIVCAMDARRNQVYNANFAAENGALTRLTEDRAIALADLAEELRSDPRPITVVGDGARLCHDFLENAGLPCRLAPAHLVMQNAVSVALEAEALAAAGELLTAQELLPFYLRPPQAETLKQRAANH